MNIFRIARTLSRRGVLGINARNVNYIQRYNKREFYPNADSKMRAKQLARSAAIPVPELYDVVYSIGQFDEAMEKVAERSEFVVKPDRGSGGEGVLVLSREESGELADSSGYQISPEDLKTHIANTLSGLYSLGGQPDFALFEYRVAFDPVFEAISYRGVPDIRIIVFKGIPALAMLRLPTSRSGGRANLHQGAVGVGISIARGVTTRAVLGTTGVDTHPDTGNSVTGVSIPHWNEMLRIAASGYEVFKLGYFGVDLVVDKNRGPMMLEVNVRPGLGIQIANRVGLKSRLAVIERAKSLPVEPEERVQFALDHLTDIRLG